MDKISEATALSQSQQSDIKKWNPYFSDLLRKQIR